MKTRFSVVLLGLAFAALPMATVRAADLWEDPAFVERVTATYWVRGDLEPSVTRQEQELLGEVAGQMPDNPGEAVAVLDRALRPESSAALDFTRGNLRFQLEEYGGAEEHYREAIRKFPDFLRAHKNLGLVLIRQEKYADAVAALGRALTLGSADGDTYGLIGFAHLQLGNWVSAEAASRQALLFETDDLNWQIALVQALQGQERQNEAGNLLAEMIGRWPDRADLWMYQANVFVATDRAAEAAENLELVRRMGAISQSGLLLLADIYTNQDLPGLALGAFEEAFESDSAVPTGRAARAAERLSRQGHIDAAVQLVQWMNEDSPPDLSPGEKGQLRRLQGRLALARNQPDEGRRLLEEALEINPLDGESLLLLAGLVGKSDLEHAEVLLEQAARLSGTAEQALRQRGELLVGAGRYENALVPLREAQDLRPRDDLRRYIEQVERLAELGEAANR